MGVGVDQAGQQRVAAGVDDRHAGRDDHLIAWADSADAPVLDDQGAARDDAVVRINGKDRCIVQRKVIHMHLIAI